MQVSASFSSKTVTKSFKALGFMVSEVLGIDLPAKGPEALYLKMQK